MSKEYVYCQCDDSECDAHHGECMCNRMVDPGMNLCPECHEYWSGLEASVLNMFMTHAEENNKAFFGMLEMFEEDEDDE